jgi:adenylate kinase
MRTILIAPPGAGKGTQAARIAARYGITHISSGDLFRRHVAEGTPEAEALREYTQRGDLVPDDVVFSMLIGPIIKASAAGGYVLDGFPRSVPQAEEAFRQAVDLGVTAHAVLSFEVSESDVLSRVRGRAAEEGRADDADEAVVRHRLEVYRESTVPLVAFYEKRGIVHHIDASPPIDEVSAAIFEVLDNFAV